MITRRWRMMIALAAIVGVSGEAVSAATAKTRYESALAREQALRIAARRGQDPSLKQVRDVIAEYEAVVKRFPASGYADNALYQAAMLAADAYRRLVDETDRRTAVRLLNELIRRYPASSLLAPARGRLKDLDLSPTAPMRAAMPPLPSAAPLGIPAATLPMPAVASAPVVLPPAAMSSRARGTGSDSRSTVALSTPDVRVRAAPVVAIRQIKRITLPEVVRVQIELDGEVAFHEERLDNPARMFVDLKGARPAPSLIDAVLDYPDDAVRKIRVGRHPQSTTRVVLDLSDVSRYSVFTLYNPFRIVIDCERRDGVRPRATTGANPQPVPVPDPEASADEPTEARPGTAANPTATPIPSNAGGTKTAAAPRTPARNLRGGFSLARQLGLGVSRIVVDPGHGGHDPGAQGPGGVVESALVLDVALRLEKLLSKDPAFEVLMTRRTDEFIPLEERTAIANRESADLFLSIHANASPNSRARGVETYFLNFASNPDAAAVAARENLTTGRTMNNLPDIVKAITLSNKIDESRDFATMVQESLVQRLRAPNKALRDLGVKQAPFVVLIGAAMPSVLAEISFVTNRQEATLLRGGAYRQRIAEALFNAVVNYQRSLKSTRSVAKREAQE